ncbi:hypothetical protein LAX5112_04116 [Roseibium alexandrii]|uniref:Uncharacterized protein n=1 Tax=Roseibium alexandrii TaxID=388408 RepID=A0A0M7AL10_9HYPH|nr:hypothetical protein LAX5112_04116 [Roseibium alexandrii]
MQIVMAIVAGQIVVAGPAVQLVGTVAADKDVVVRPFDFDNLAADTFMTWVRIGAAVVLLIMRIEDQRVLHPDVDGEDAVVKVPVAAIVKVFKPERDCSGIGFQDASGVQNAIRVQINGLAESRCVIRIGADHRFSAVRRDMIQPWSVTMDGGLIAIRILEHQLGGVFAFLPNVQIQALIAAVQAVAIGDDKETERVTGLDIQVFPTFALNQIAAASLQRGVRPQNLDVCDKSIFLDLVVAESVSIAGCFTFEHNRHRMIIHDLNAGDLDQVWSTGAVEDVVAVVAIEDIVACAAPDFVISVLSGHDVVPEAAGHNVRMPSANKCIVFIRPDHGTRCGQTCHFLSPYSLRRTQSKEAVAGNGPLTLQNVHVRSYLIQLDRGGVDLDASGVTVLHDPVFDFEKAMPENAKQEFCANQQFSL